MTGYEALRTTAAWFDLTGRGLIRMTGDDRARLLHAMTTNDINGLVPGNGCYTFFLNAQGRILADANVYALKDSFLLDTEPATRAKVSEHLDRYIIADDVTLEDETSQWAVIGVEGPDNAEAMRKLDAPTPEQARSIQAWGGGFVSAASATGAPGFRIFVPVAERAALLVKLEKAGVVEATKEEVNIVRLEHGTPRYGDDISERFLTQETNQIHAVSFNKGCYLGQEIVERVRSRAQIHRVLHAVKIHSTSVPEAGTKLALDDKPAGEITSAAFSPAWGAVAALAYVKVEQVHEKREMHVTGMDGARAEIV